jgi:hypothetical protein
MKNEQHPANLNVRFLFPPIESRENEWKEMHLPHNLVIMLDYAFVVSIRIQELNPYIQTQGGLPPAAFRPE